MIAERLAPTNFRILNTKNKNKRFDMSTPLYDPLERLPKYYTHLAREVTRRASHAESRKHEESLNGLFDAIDSGVSPGAPAMRAPCTCTVSSLTRVLKELDGDELQQVGAFLSTLMGTSIYTSVSFPAPVEVAKRSAKMEEIYTRGQRWL